WCGARFRRGNNVRGRTWRLREEGWERRENGLHGLSCESQPDSRSKGEDGNGDDRTPQSRVHGSNRGQVHEGCRGHPHSGAVREVQSGVQQGEERKGRGLNTCFANGGRRRCYLRKSARPLLRARFAYGKDPESAT